MSQILLEHVANMSRMPCDVGAMQQYHALLPAAKKGFSSAWSSVVLPQPERPTNRVMVPGCSSIGYPEQLPDRFPNQHKVAPQGAGSVVARMQVQLLGFSRQKRP